MNYFFFNSINNFLSFSLWIFISCWWISFFSCFFVFAHVKHGIFPYVRNCIALIFEKLWIIFILRLEKSRSVSVHFVTLPRRRLRHIFFSKSTDSFWRYYRIRMNNEKCKYFQLIFNHGENSTRNSAMKFVFCWSWWRISLLYWPDEFTSMHFVE